MFLTNKVIAKHNVSYKSCERKGNRYYIKLWKGKIESKHFHCCPSAGLTKDELLPKVGQSFLYSSTVCDCPFKHRLQETLWKHFYFLANSFLHEISLN